ncbi:MAG: TetR/AcrR family transcriptional regulator [Sphingorhabdus sp.]
MDDQNIKENDTEPSSGRRQHAMDQRRRRIIRAAGELIVQNDNGNFTMPELAARASVSLATPYNLFGSKATILSALFERQIKGFHNDNADLLTSQPADRVFALVDRLVSAFARDPQFFRNLWKALHSLGPLQYGQFPIPATARLLHPFVDSLGRDGHLPEAVSKHIIETTLFRIFNSLYEEWAIQDWSESQLREELRASYALVLHGFFKQPDRARLEQVIFTE